MYGPPTITFHRHGLLLLDLFQKGFQRGLVAGVARHHIVGWRKPFWSYHQGHDHLPAIRPLVLAVAETPFAAGRRVALEIPAGQVVKQDLEFRLESAS